MILHRYLYFSALPILIFVPCCTCGVIIIDNFTTGLGTSTGTISATLGSSPVIINGATFNRTITADFNPTFTHLSGPFVSPTTPVNSMTLAITSGSPPFSETGSSRVGGMYLTKAPLAIMYDYGNINLAKLSLSYIRNTTSDFIDLGSNTLVRSDIASSGGAVFHASVSAPSPSSFTASFSYTMTFSDGTHTASVPGVSMSGFEQFNAGTISGTVNLAHIVSMVLEATSTSSVGVIFGGAQPMLIDTITLTGSMDSSASFIEAVPEPMTCTALGAGLVAFLIRRKRIS